MIPDSLQELTTEWLSAALGAHVTGYDVADAHDGTTGRALLNIHYSDDSSGPDSIFVKLPPADEAQRAFVVSSGMGKLEARFYQRLSAEVPVRVPRCYHANCDDSGEHYIMLLENLESSGCTFQNASHNTSLDYPPRVLDAFAALHAQYWQTERFETDLDWLAPPVQHEIAILLIEQALSQHAADMPPVFTDLGELYLKETDAIHQLWDRGAHTVVHGDVHDGNLFMDNGTPGFFDWAIVSRAPAMRDVGYFLAGALTPEQQDAHGREMVEHYREQLLQRGVEANLEELWQQYQWHAAYVWVGAAVTLAMGDAWQPINYVKNTLQRLHHALEVLGSVDSIRENLRNV